VSGSFIQLWRRSGARSRQSVATTTLSPVNAGDTILLVLLGPIVVSAGYWFAVVHRVLRARRLVPQISSMAAEEQATPAHTPLISVVVPAHNEEEEIAECVRTLLAQDYPHLEIVIVLDRCTDSTAERLAVFAGDSRLRVVHNDSCPADWAGKCNAASRGAREARGDWLLFTDADTRFDPRLARAAVTMAMARSLDLLSLLSTLSTMRWFEKVIQPVASMNLMRLYPIDRVNRPGSKRNFANGQFLFISRQMYEKCGGHGAVKQALLEDIALARAVRKAGGRGETFFDGGMLRCSMYTSFPAFREGWKRIFIDACRRRPWRMRKNALRLLVLGAGDPALRVLAIVLAIAALQQRESERLVPALVIAGAILASIAKNAALIVTYRAARSPLLGVPLYSWGAVQVARILFQGAGTLSRRIPIRWGGRDYTLEPQGPWN
jgi:glycosyltransferase involved in cell wall biosynthesis